MPYTSTILTYPILTILSTCKRSFENMGLLIQKSGDTVRRLLRPAPESLLLSRSISQSMFKEKRKLLVGIDDTLIKKIHSQFMWGAGMFFDTKIGRCIMAYRLVIGVATDGRFAIPIDCAYLFAKELLDQAGKKFPTKDDLAKSFVATALKLFPKAKIIVVVDGLYTSVEFVKWCRLKNIALEARMHSNRIIYYKGKRIKVRDLLQMKGMRPIGRQMARTISVLWHNIDLELTVVKRLDKHQNESFVFQIATYKASPREHVENYQRRWSVEMVNRTTKQSIGLGDCFSRVLETQYNHVAAVLFAYALAQLKMKLCKLDTPEQAIRRCKTKKVNFLINSFTRILNNIQQVDA
jgi:hypothetical protein